MNLSRNRIKAIKNSSCISTKGAVSSSSASQAGTVVFKYYLLGLWKLCTDWIHSSWLSIVFCLQKNHLCISKIVHIQVCIGTCVTHILDSRIPWRKGRIPPRFWTSAFGHLCLKSFAVLKPGGWWMQLVREQGSHLLQCFEKAIITVTAEVFT